MSSLSEVTVLRGRDAGSAAPLPTRDLSSGVWTRDGDSQVVGDPITERTLDALAERTRAAATAQGYAVGWADGRRRAAEEAALAAAAEAERATAAEARRGEEHERAVAALVAAAEAVRAQAGAVTAALESQGTEFVLALLRALLDHELRVATSADVVRRVLRLLPDEPAVRVRLAPGVIDDAVVQDLRDRGVAMVADPELGPADAVVTTDDSVLDLRIASALDRVTAALERGGDHG